MEGNATPTAFLVMDIQNAIVKMLPGADGAIGNIARAIAHARGKGLPVIYVRVGFRKGAPEISASNKGFSAAKERYVNADPEEFMKIDERVAPLEDDIIVTKRRVSAFAGSDLEVVLRSLEIRHLVLTGFVTSGVVLSTLREAADKDYGITVLPDCCKDWDEEVHNVLTTKVFPRQANVLSSAEWMSNK